jgi:hypothetical protein
MRSNVFKPRAVALWSACMLLWLCALLWTWPAWANSKLLELERGIADLSLLDQQLEDRLQQARKLRAELDDQQQTFTAEAKAWVRSLKITSLQQAQQHPRIHYNIALLGTVLSYIRELDNKIAFYQAGRDRLGYLRQLAEDDKRMISVLNDFKVDALTTSISTMIDLYLAEAHAIRIDPQTVSPLPSRHVWDRIRI